MGWVPRDRLDRGSLRVRSRRGWDMTEHVGFLAELPVRAALDGELVALDEDGKPDFPELCGCVLMRQRSTPLTFMVFDVLSVEGEPVVSLPHSERRAPGRWSVAGADVVGLANERRRRQPDASGARRRSKPKRAA